MLYDLFHEPIHGMFVLSFVGPCWCVLLFVHICAVFVAFNVLPALSRCFFFRIRTLRKIEVELLWMRAALLVYLWWENLIDGFQAKDQHLIEILYMLL